MSSPAAVLLPGLCTSARGLVQPLGSENEWRDVGGGVFEIHGHTLRLVDYSASATKADDGEEQLSRQAAEVITRAHEPVVVLEDQITDDTPFVGENFCLVWNSVEQSLSMCVMFSDEGGYAASWSALHAAQHKQYPPIGFDVLEPLVTVASKSNAAGTKGDDLGKEYDASTATENITALLEDGIEHFSFVEKHAIACSIIDNDYGRKLIDANSSSSSSSSDDASSSLKCSDRGDPAADQPAGGTSPYGNTESAASADGACNIQQRRLVGRGLFSSPAATISLLRFNHTDLLEYLVGDGVVEHFVRGLGVDTPVPSWSIPPGLETVLSPAAAGELRSAVTSALRMHFLKHEVLPIGTDEDILSMLDSLVHRSQNEVVCGILGDDAVIEWAQKQLADESTSAKQAATVLKFLSSLVTLSFAAFSRELLPHVFAKIFGEDLLQALSFVCWRHAHTTAKPQSRGTSQSSSSGGLSADDVAITTSSREGSPQILISESTPNEPIAQPFAVAPPKGPRGASGRNAVAKVEPSVEPQPKRDQSAESTTSSGTSSHESSGRRSPSFDPAEHADVAAVEVELLSLLEVVVVKLNERCEEGPMNDIFRAPIARRPDTFAPLMAFLMRNLACGGGTSRNKLVVYHLLGMHDDEGSQSERSTDPAVVEPKDAFHTFFIQNVLTFACRGKLCTGSGPPGSFPISMVQTPTAAQPIAITAPLIRVLEYMLVLCSDTNRKLLTSILLHPKSLIVAAVIGAAEACKVRGPRHVHVDDLTQNVRFLRALVAKGDESVARYLITERDAIGPYLQLYATIGSRRRSSLFHCTVMSTLMLVHDRSAQSDALRHLRSYIVLQHRAHLPAEYVARVEKALLAKLVADIAAAEPSTLGPRIPPHLMASPIPSRAPSPHSAAAMLEVSNVSAGSSDGSEQRRARSRPLVDELREPLTAKEMEENAGFGPKLREKLGRLSPTPGAMQPPADRERTPSPGGLDAMNSAMSNSSAKHLAATLPPVAGNAKKKPTAPTLPRRSTSKGVRPRSKEGSRPVAKV